MNSVTQSHQEMRCRPCCSRSPLRGPGPFAHSHPVQKLLNPARSERSTGTRWDPEDFCSNPSRSPRPTHRHHRCLSVQVGTGRDEDLEAVQLLLHGRPNQWRLALLAVCLERRLKGVAWRSHVRHTAVVTRSCIR